MKVGVVRKPPPFGQKKTNMRGGGVFNGIILI
jgi:hypothetical protein